MSTTKTGIIKNWLNNCLDSYKLPVVIIEELQAAAAAGASHKKLLAMIQADQELLAEFKADIIKEMNRGE